jgi:hypothetical protein
VLTAPAPLPVASSLPSTLPLEQIIGEVTADAAVVLARALCEFQTDGLSSRTRGYGGDQIARLFELWQVCAGQIDFYVVARARGARLLQERYGRDINARTIAVLIDGVLEILQQIVRVELN